MGDPYCGTQRLRAAKVHSNKSFISNHLANDSTGGAAVVVTADGCGGGMPR